MGFLVSKNMKRGISNNLSKDAIFAKVSQEMIMARYLNIPLEVVLDCIANNTLILSPLRIDHCPTFGIQYNKKNKLKARDFNGVFFGDVFDVVAYVLTYSTGRIIDVNLKSDFYFILKHIAYTFKNIINGSEVDVSNNELIKESLNKIKKHKSIIDVIPRQYNSKDRDIWAKWGIDISYLQTHFVIPVDMYYIDKYVQPTPKYHYDPKDPCYAYVLGLDSNGIYNVKLYFPLRHKGNVKFITNNSSIEGIIHLDRDDYDIICITKSSKDRLSIGNHIRKFPLRGELNELEIGIINLSSESHYLNQCEFDYLNSKLAEGGMIVSFCDFDKTGRKCAKHMKDAFNIPYIFITRGELGLNDYGAKDFAELKESYSDEVVNEFVNETLECLLI